MHRIGGAGAPTNHESTGATQGAPGTPIVAIHHQHPVTTTTRASINSPRHNKNNGSKPTLSGTLPNNIIGGVPYSSKYQLPPSTSPRKELGPSLRRELGPSSNTIPRKELGPSTRPSGIPFKGLGAVERSSGRADVSGGVGGLLPSRVGSLARTTYDGKIAGLYDLEETLGRGHFAVVKLARHVFTGEKVAVKVIDKAKLDEVSRAHLFQEVRCMKLVQHPNVVRLYEVIDTQTKLYLILELADGGDLYDYIMRHEEGLGEEQARKYFRQIVHAISYCHKLHVVHRDLKPENVVFFERLGMVKLTDFGFSNRFNPGQKLETSCGSLAYSAPEILLGDSYDAPAVDVWSLGVILYMLVCGHAPFQEANDSETLTMIMDCKYTIPPYVSEQCAKLIARMLVREPERRATLEELARDPWLGVDSSIQPAEFLPLISREHVSEEDHAHIIQKMVNGKIASKEEILEALDKNEYNHITATYFLLAERKLRAHRQEQAQKAARTSDSSSIAPSQLISTPSPQLLSPGSPGDILGAGKPSAQPASVPRLSIASQGGSTLLSVPGEVPQQDAARGRKCSIVTEEDDDEEEEEMGSSSGREDDAHSSHSLLSRRGSRSEGKLSLALQERLAEAERRKEAIRPSTAAPPTHPRWKTPHPTPRLTPRTSLTTSPSVSVLTPQRPLSSITSSSTVSIPIIHAPPSTTSPQSSRFKTLPSPSRPLHAVSSSPQLTLNEIFEEGSEEAKKAIIPTVPRVVVTRQKFHKTRTASCSSSDASDDDSEGRKKRAHKLKTLPGNSRRRDSHDDSSDSQGGKGGGGGAGGGGESGGPESRSAPTVADSGGGDKQQQQQSGGGSGSGGNGRRHHHSGFRRRCGTAGETRLRESQSLNRITEVQESAENLTQNLAGQSTATSPRSRRSFGARFLLLVGKKPSEGKEEKENCSKAKLTRYFQLHRKLCLPLFKPHHSSAAAASDNNVVWLGAGKPA